MNRTRRLTVASSLVFVLLSASPPGAVAARPARTAVLTPADRSQVGRDGQVPVVVELSRPGRVPSRVQLVTGRGRDRRVVDLEDRAVVDGRRLRAELGPGDLVPGVSELRVGSARSRFSWEPSIDAATAGRCDVIDPARCLLPFPNDRFTVSDPEADTGRRVQLDVASMPANASGTHIEPAEWNRNDGFSPGSMILASVPGIDLVATGAAPVTDIARSLDPDAPIVLLDADTGERHPYWAELDANAEPPEEPALIVRPAVNLAEGHRYVVALRNLRRGDGSVIEAGRGFAIYRDDVATFIPAVEARRRPLESVFRTLRRARVDRDELHLAWDFTVASERSLSERLLHMRDDAFASLGAAAPSFTVDDVEDFADPAVEPELLRRVSGTFTVPNYMTGDGGPGTRLTNAVGDGLPRRNADYTASYVCNIPRSVSVDGRDPVRPVRGAIYGHGLLGDRGQVSGGNLQSLSLDHGMLFCGTDWIGMSEEDIGNAVGILQDLSRFPTLADRLQQGILNNLFLARLVKIPEGFGSHPAFRFGASSTPAIDAGEVYYLGGSQGGILGGAATAVSQEWTEAVLGVPGMNYSTLLDRSIDFDAFRAVFNPSYPDPLDRQIALALIQMLWDRGESNGYAHHTTGDPYEATPEHRVLLQMSFGDHQVANVATEVMARTMGASIRQPALDPGRSSDVAPYWGIPPIPAYPFRGSALVVWDIGPLRDVDGEVAGTLPPPTTNTPPREGVDPHGPDASEEPSGRVQRSAFLQPDGAVVDVCGERPCYLDGWTGPPGG